MSSNPLQEKGRTETVSKSKVSGPSHETKHLTFSRKIAYHSISKSIAKDTNFLLSGKHTLLSKCKVTNIYQCSECILS